MSDGKTNVCRVDATDRDRVGRILAGDNDLAVAVERCGHRRVTHIVLVDCADQIADRVAPG